MTNRTFQAFFSYAHADAEADPNLIEALTKDLEQRINVKFANDQLKIWRDIEGLRLGDKWEPKIEGILRESDILIVLLTPRWLGSEYCCREYGIFEEVEIARGTEDFAAGYVASILIRDIEKEKSNLTPEQAKIYASIKKRQYQRLLARDFLVLPKAKRNKIVDEIADDIQGIIERRRTNPDKTRTPAKVPRKRNTPTTEFDVRAFNYDEIDFVSNAEVLFDRRKAGEFAVYAQIDFVHRLYVHGKHGRVEFGVRRAHLRIANDGPGELTKVLNLKGGDRQNSRYVAFHDAPNAIGVCMDPPAGRTSIAELALPPAENENYLSKVAAASDEVATDRLRAELAVDLNVEGLYLADAERTPSQRMLMNIQAIIDTVVAKAATSEDQSMSLTGKLRRKLRVTDRT